MRKLFVLVFTLISFVMLASTQVRAREVCNDTSFYEYGSNTEYMGEDVEWTHTKTNPTDYPESVTFTLTRSVYAEINTTVVAKQNAVLYEVGIELEVGFGTSTTWTESIGYIIPPYTTRTLVYGHHYVQTVGVVRYYTMYCTLLSTTYINGEWSYESFSR